MISLLIHGFLSVNARLLIAFGTAFYAIISINVLWATIISQIEQVHFATPTLRSAPSERHKLASPLTHYAHSVSIKSTWPFINIKGA